MAAYSQKLKGKEVGQASVYAEPHTMDGKKVKAAPSKGVSGAQQMDDLNISIGTISKGRVGDKVKTTGITERGTGAAIRGKVARGPMG